MNGAPGTSLGSLCQCLATLTAEKLPLMPGLSLPRHSSVLTHTSHRQPAAEAGASLSTPILRKLQRSPLGLLLSRRQPRCPQVSALTVENQGCQSPEPFFWLQALKDHQRCPLGTGSTEPRSSSQQPDAAVSWTPSRRAWEITDTDTHTHIVIDTYALCVSDIILIYGGNK